MRTTGGTEPHGRTASPEDTMRPQPGRRTALDLFRSRAIYTGTFALALGVIIPGAAGLARGPDLTVPAPNLNKAVAPAPSLATAGNPRRSPVVEVIERVRGAVVNIHSERAVHAAAEDIFHQAPGRVNGMGTGIVIDPRG